MNNKKADCEKRNLQKNKNIPLNNKGKLCPFA